MIDFTSLEKMGKKQNNYIMYYTHKKTGSKTYRCCRGNRADIRGDGKGPKS